MIDKNKEKLIYKALTDAYKVVAFIDIDADTFERVYFETGEFETFAASKKADEMLEIAMNYYVDGQYVDALKQFMDLSSLRNRLKGKSIVSMEFDSSRLGWCRASFVPVELYDDGTVKSVVYKIQKLDGELLAMRKKLSIEETLIECVRLLTNNDDFDASINKLLSIIAEYHQAERAYIFDIDYDKGLVHNTYEWCHEGVEPQIDFLKNVDIKAIDRWLDYFNKGECLSISSLSGEVDRESVEYHILEAQDVEGLMAAPFILKGQIVGFIGVDNPRANLGTHVLMKSVSDFIVEELQKKQYVELLYNLSYRDKMTGLLNRHAYIDAIDEHNASLRKNVGIVFADANGLKITNDTYGHEFGDRLLINVASSLKEWFDGPEDKVYRIGGDEFIVICHDIGEREFQDKVDRYIDKLGENPIASVGEVWIDTCRDLEKQVMAADRLMYQRKSEYHKKMEEKM